MSDIIIVCDGGCGKTTEGMTWETRSGEFEQTDESGVPKWTCPDCWVALLKGGSKVGDPTEPPTP